MNRLQGHAEILAHASGEALVALSLAGEVLWWGDGATAVFGHASDEALGQPLAELVGVVSGQSLDEVLDEARLTRSAVWCAQVRRKGGVELQLEAVLRYVESEGWISLAGRDVSDRERITRELMHKSWELEGRLAETRWLFAETQRLTEELVQRGRLAAIGELAAGIGHDLRNPLAAIKNALRYMSKRLDPDRTEPRIVQYLGLALKELGNCEQTIAGLLAYARDAPMTLTTCGVRGLLADAVGVVARPAHVTIDLQASPELPPVEVDATQLRRVLVNLVQNACEAIPASRAGLIRVSAAADDTSIVVVVADDGDGIAPEVRERLFDPLFTTKARGTGLGLAVVARIVERHGGQIAVESTVGAGAVFTVRIPLRGAGEGA